MKASSRDLRYAIDDLRWAVGIKGMAISQSARCAGSGPDWLKGLHPSRSGRDYGATGRDPAHQLWAKSESNHFSGFQCSANGSIPGVSNDFQSIPITFEKIMKPKDYLTRQGKIGCRPRARMNNEARMSNGGLRLVYPAKSAEIRP